MILNHFEGSEKETWKQTQGRSQSVLQYYTVQCVYSRSTAASYRLCTHAVLQCVLQAIQQVDEVVWKQVLDDLSAENTSLIDVNHFPHLQPADRMLRRRQASLHKHT